MPPPPPEHSTGTASERAPACARRGGHVKQARPARRRGPGAGRREVAGSCGPGEWSARSVGRAGSQVEGWGAGRVDRDAWLPSSPASPHGTCCPPHRSAGSEIAPGLAQHHVPPDVRYRSADTDVSKRPRSCSTSRHPPVQNRCNRHGCEQPVCRTAHRRRCTPARTTRGIRVRTKRRAAPHDAGRPFDAVRRVSAAPDGGPIRPTGAQIT